VGALGAALAVLSAVSPSAALFEQGVPAFKTFTTADGLPASTVQSLALDAQGQLWVGTQEGVAVHQGAALRPVPLADRASRFVNALLPASDGSLWLGTTGGGLLRNQGADWARFDDSSGLPSPHVYALLEVPGPKGVAILAGTAKGLARYEGGAWSLDALGPLHSPSVKVLVRGKDGTLYIGTEGGLVVDRGGARTIFDVSAGLPDPRVRSLLVATDAKGNEELWIGTEAGLCLLRGRKISCAEGVGLPPAPVVALARSAAPGGPIWAGTSGGGLAERRGNRWRIYSRGHGLPDNSVLTLLAQERAGRSILWIGTDAGLARLVEGGFRSYAQGPPLLRDKATALLEIPAGPARGFWLATGSGLHRFDGERWNTLRLDGAGDVPYSLAADGAGGLLVGSQGGHLFRFDGRALAPVAFPASTNNTVRALLEVRAKGRPAELWVARRSGLLRRREGRWEEVDDAGFPSPWFMSLAASRAPDGSVRLWAGSYGGLSSFDGARWQHWTAKTGLPHDAISSLNADDRPGQRALWVGTGGGGAVRIDLEQPGAPWLTFSESTRPALRNAVIMDIQRDAQGAIHLLTNRGVQRLWRQGGDWAVEGFAAQDGLPSEECLFGAGATDVDGRVWVATTGGIAALQPSPPRPAAPAPMVFTRLTVRGTQAPLSEDARLSHRENALTFEFTHLGYFRDEETRYRSQLVGLEAEPTGWRAEAKREFPTLPAGSYEMRVWARDHAGVVSGPIARRFSIAQPPWLSAWAIALYAASALGLTAGAVSLRTRALHARARMLEQKVEERNSELAESN
jgi:ligand-binding sensor domain-containing protein